MELSEKLYTLRKKSGLSQEQLAEQLNVSRQAISKWETGQSVPESDKLLAISSYFNVSLDYLLKETDDQTDSSADHQDGTPVQMSNRPRFLFGIIICVIGIICLIIWGVLSIVNPAAANQISQSSMIHIDGNGIFLLLCIAAIVIGAVLLINDTAKK